MKLWICKGVPANVGDEAPRFVATTKRRVERLAADHYGYEDIAVAKSDGWIHDARLYDVQNEVGRVMLMLADHLADGSKS